MGILILVLMLVILVVFTCDFRNVKRDDDEVLYNLYFDKDGFPIWEELKKDRSKREKGNMIMDESKNKSVLWTTTNLKVSWFYAHKYKEIEENLRYYLLITKQKVRYILQSYEILLMNQQNKIVKSFPIVREVLVVF